MRGTLGAHACRGTSGAALSALQWAGIDSGRWDEALAAAREASDTAAAYKMETVASSADPATATVLAMRGDHEQVRPLLASALASVDAAEYRGYTARARHAGGIAALAAGSYLAAWGQLSQLFGTDGAPLHHHISYLGIADLAAAGVRAERPLEARTLLERALAQADQAPAPRLEQLTARACGLLADPGGAEGFFGRHWPIPPGTRGRSSGPSCAWTTGSGCGDSGGSTRLSPSSRPPWTPSAASAPHPGLGAPKRNCAPAA